MAVVRRVAGVVRRVVGVVLQSEAPGWYVHLQENRDFKVIIYNGWYIYTMTALKKVAFTNVTNVTLHSKI